MSEDVTARRSLKILMERVRWEASEFEEDVEGEPFLPDVGSEDAKDRFSHFCVDLERFIGCDRVAVGLPPKPARPCLLYHASWMIIPGRGMLLDSIGRFSETRDVPADHREFLNQFVYEVRQGINDPGKTSSMPLFFGAKRGEMAGGHTFIEAPFLLILYISGRHTANSETHYNLVSGVFGVQPEADLALINQFATAIAEGKRNAFYALHYTTLPSERRVKVLSAQVQPRFAQIAEAILQSEHPLQSEIGIEFVEAVTAHFQRQWGDRQAYQRKLTASLRANEDMISHELCRNLYCAIGLIDRGQGYVQTASPRTLVNVGRYLEAAEESVLACFAAPYLSRRSQKRDTRPLWDRRTGPVSMDEITSLVAAFDRKLVAICNAERPLRRHVEVWREHKVDGVMIDLAMLLDLGEGPGDWAADTRVRAFSGWPFASRERESMIDNQGRQALLFGVQNELIRNAIGSAARFTTYEEDNVSADYGIHVVIDIASDGSKISGSVRNKYAFGHGPSDIPSKIIDKLTGMSEGLEAWFVERGEVCHLAWTLRLMGSGKNARG